MGTPKALLPFAGSTIVARVVDAFTGGGVDHILVIVRPDDSQVLAALADRRVCLAENPDPDGDMLSSLRCGLRTAPHNTHAFVVSPVDQPSLTPEVVRQALAVFTDSERPILVPVHAGKRGHPVILAARFRNELLTSFDGIGLRGLLQAHPAEVHEWQTPSPAVIQDLDTPEEYRQSRPA